MIIQQLRDVGGTIAKTRILKEATELDLKMFRYAYDKNYVYGTKFQIDITSVALDPTPEDFELLDKLRTRALSGHAARVEVLKHCQATGSDTVKLVCNKDLDCGVSAATVNKVRPGTIPVFKVQLAKEVPLSKVKFPCFAEIKYDGVRLIIRKEEKAVSFATRNGKLVNLPKLSKLVANSSLFNNVLDVEVTLESGKMTDRAKVSGLINSAMKGGTIDEDVLRFNVFDAMTLYEFDNQSCNEVYSSRRGRAESCVKALQSSQFVIAQATLCHERADVQSLYADAIDTGFEGLILKAATSRYLFKRSAEWVKMKETKSADLQCYDWEEGTGQFEGQIGALLCQGTVEGKAVKVSVGTGFSHAERAVDIWTYVGKTIEVKYNSVVRDKHKHTYSLFLPRFTCVRIDK